MNYTVAVTILLLLSNNSNAQNTLIPDSNFEQALIDLGLDNVIDGQVQTSTIATVNFLNVQNKNINNLTGIEDFTALEFLFCSNNSLSTINVSQNINLISLSCSYNLLSSLDVTQNSNLGVLRCTNNVITNLNLSQNTSLTSLICSNNLLSSIAVNQNAILQRLECTNNVLTNINVTQNPNLKFLICNNNQLENLNVSQNSALITLECNNNQLLTIDFTVNSILGILECKNNQLTLLETDNFIDLEVIICNNNQITNMNFNSVVLQAIDCSNNLLTDLNLSQSNNLSFINCSNNAPLTFLDIRNNITTSIFPLIATSNPNLTCIFVDDANASTINWDYDSLISNIVETEEECDAILNINEIKPELYFSIYPNPANDYFTINTIYKVKKVKIHDLFGKLIKTYPNQENYSISTISNGIYVVSIENEKGFFYKKFIKN